MAQGAIIDVQDARPDDRPLIDAQLIAVMEVVVDDRGEKVVGGGDGVEVPGQMQVHAFSGLNARLPGAARPALDAKGRAHRRLTQGERRALAAADQGLGQADGDGRLALPEGRGRHTGDDDVATRLR